LSLLDVPSDDPEWPSLDPLQRRRRTLDAVKRLLLRESQRQPLLLVFEDLHWIDSETQAVLDGLVESLPAAQLLLLVNYRPEYQHPWGGRTYYTQLRLDPLPPEAAEHLLSALLGPDASLDALKRVLITRTEGNPFFLEESVRSLVETGALVGGRGACRVSGPIHATQVPVTVQAVLAARIDRLPFEDKRLLQSASVIGKDVPFVLLHAVGEESEDALRHRLAQLQAAEFIYETSLFPDLEYTFKHALTHEVAYGSMLSDRRRGLHARIVEAIERLYPDRFAEQVGKLAYHALRGELWDKTVAYSREGGIKAAGRSAYHEAVASFEQALDALTKLPLTQKTLEQAVDIRFELRYALWPLGQHRRGLDHMRDAQPIAAQLGDQRRLARLWAQTASAQYLVGDYRGALEAGHRALELAIELGDLRIRVDAGHFLGATYHSLGDYGRSRQLLAANVTALTGEWLRRRFGAFYAVYARTWLTWGLGLQGQFEVADAMAEEAARTVNERYPADVTAASWSVGYARLQRGDVSEAVSVLERCDSVARDASVNVWWGPITGSLEYACVLSGAFERGIRLLEGITEPGATENLPGISEWQAYLADGYLLAGRLGRAVEAADRAVTMARERGERGAEALALRVQADIAGAHDPVGSRAEELYRQGLTLADELGMRPLVAHCHLGLGTQFCRVGDGAKAVEHLATATTMYREMEMGFWLEKAEAARREPGPRAGRKKGDPPGRLQGFLEQ
jgi:tetratricopeptide (TPR) repeat protein